MDIWHFLPIMLGVAAGIRYAPVLPERWRAPAALVLIVGFLVWAPYTLSIPHTGQLTSIGVWLIAAMGLNILTGYNGQISLGHGALVAFGAYVSAILMDGTEQMSFVDATPWPFWTTIIVAGVSTAVLGMLLGIPFLRLSGPYLAIATLALAISLPNVMRKYAGFTGGSQGILVSQPQPPGFLDGLVERGQWHYFIALTTAALMLFLAWFLLRGPLGRALVAVRDSEVAAEAMGVNVARTKVTAFTVSAFFAGVAGGLYMQVFGFIGPDAISLFQSINLLAAIVIGGLASILGSIIGAASLVFIPADAPGFVGRFPGLGTDFLGRAPGIIQGALTILVILLSPRGIAGLIGRLEQTRSQDLVEGLKAVPARVGASLDELRERLAWSRGVPPASGGTNGSAAD